MKSQPKLHLPQLNLPLLDQIPIAIPVEKDEELVHALVELLLSVAHNANPALAAARGEDNEPEVNN
jgi:hypothetical protein